MPPKRSRSPKRTRSRMAAGDHGTEESESGARWLPTCHRRRISPSKSAGESPDFFNVSSAANRRGCSCARGAIPPRTRDATLEFQQEQPFPLDLPVSRRELTAVMQLLLATLCDSAADYQG